MNYADAQSRRQSLREGQTIRAKLVPGQPVDMEAVAAEARNSGVPAMFAGISRGDFADLPEYDTVTKVLSAMTSSTEYNGVYMFGPDLRYLGRIAGAVYTGAMARNLSAKWYTFPEYVDQLTQKISFDQQNEWDVGELRDWVTELESAKNCYDLVVVHGLVDQMVSNFVGNELYKLLSSRCVRGLYTLLTAKGDQSESMWVNAPANAHLLSEEFSMLEAVPPRAR